MVTLLVQHILQSMPPRKVNQRRRLAGKSIFKIYSRQYHKITIEYDFV